MLLMDSCSAHAKGSIKYYGVKEYDEKKCTLTAEILQEEKRKEELKNEMEFKIVINEGIA